MINNNSDNILDSNVAKAIVMGTHNPFDKKICSNCKYCGSKGDIKYYCGQVRGSVAADGGCSKYYDKSLASEAIK